MSTALSTIREYDAVSVLYLACLLLLFVYVSRKITSSVRSKTHPTPPGPSSLPLIGNILNIPPSGAWLALMKYKDIFGDIVHFQGLGNNVLVLNSLEAINDLLDKRGGNYAHRPIFTVAGELMELGQSMPLLPYGEEWRSHRKLAHNALSPSAVKSYHEVQENLAFLLCNDFLDRPRDFFSSVQLTAGRIIISVTYGLPVVSADDEYITHAERTMSMVEEATVPGAFLCDLLPILKHLPRWVPFQKKAMQGKRMIEKLVTMPFEHVKAEMLKGTASPSLARELLMSEHDGMENFEHRVKWTTGAMYGAGAETTYATVLTFMMAMALNPSKQTRAQAEIDSAIGAGRMPRIDDAPNLPYVRAVIKETMRWHPVLPLSIARRSDKDDVYKGYFIPKGTIVVPNVYSVALSPSEKYDPREFIPERFLDSAEPVTDPNSYAFGFGRRVCPGRYLAENSVFIMIASILSSFALSVPKGAEITPKFSLNLVSHPEPFKCIITPRSEAKVQLIRKYAARCSTE